MCGSVEIRGAAVQITDGYLSANSLQVAKFARGMGEPLGTLSYQTDFSSLIDAVVFEFCASDFSGPPELGNSNNSWVFNDG